MLRACCVVQSPVGCAVLPRMRIRPVACSITVRTWGLGAPGQAGCEEVAGQDRVGLGAQELRPGRPAPLWGGADAVGREDLPYGRRATLTPSLASSPWILRYPHPGSPLLAGGPRALMFRRVAGRPVLPRLGSGGPAAPDDVAVPARDRVRGDQQEPVAARFRYRAEQGREQCPIRIFMLARDNVWIGGDPAKATFEPEEVHTDQATGEPVAATTRYTYRDGEDRYVVSFTRSHDLSDARMIDTIKGVKHIAARLAHFDGAYLRFTGDIEISWYRGGELAGTHKDEAIWGTDVLRARPRPVAPSRSGPSIGERQTPSGCRALGGRR
jgi:hypothetical protein